MKNRKSIRLKEYDYSRVGYYFVTVCTNHHRELFWEESNRRGTIPCALNDNCVERNRGLLNAGGSVVQQYWENIPRFHPNVEIDEYVIMPNHVHGILMIEDDREKLINRDMKGAQGIEPVRINNQNKFQKIIAGSVGSIIRGFKSGVTKWYRNNTDVQIVWHRNYYEHIIRTENDLARIRKYIRENTIYWQYDEYNPQKNMYGLDESSPRADAP